MITKFTEFSDEPIKLGIKLIEETYADKSDNQNINMLLSQILNDYQKMKSGKATSKIEMFLRLNYLFDFVSGPISDKLQNKNVILLVKEALERRGIKSVLKVFRNNYDQFLKWLTSEIAANSNALSTEEQLQVNEFIELCLQFKDETVLQNKLFVTHKIVTSLE